MRGGGGGGGAELVTTLYCALHYLSSPGCTSKILLVVGIGITAAEILPPGICLFFLLLILVLEGGREGGRK